MSNLQHPDNFPVGYDRGHKATCAWPDCPGGISCEGLSMDAPCPKCLGEKRIADSEDGEPWSAWADLPPGSDLAVRMGLVKPIDCPECTS